MKSESCEKEDGFESGGGGVSSITVPCFPGAYGKNAARRVGSNGPGQGVQIGLRTWSGIFARSKWEFFEGTMANNARLGSLILVLCGCQGVLLDP